MKARAGRVKDRGTPPRAINHSRLLAAARATPGDS